MFEQLKRTLVESYVGAIALGWLFAQALVHFANIFAAPVASWIARNEYGRLTGGAAVSARFCLRQALPELVSSFSLLVIWYVLMRWVYFKPLKTKTVDATSNPEHAGTAE